jgi:hypothetical protein
MQKITKRQWLKLIEQFMQENKRVALDWPTVLDLEGGYGQDKIKSVEEALEPSKSHTWPGIWFQSGQKDYSVYNRYDYIYSLLFGRQISGGSIKLVCNDIMAREEIWGDPYYPLIIDWGGSIYTSLDILHYLGGEASMAIVNYEGPQLEFARWALQEQPIDIRTSFQTIVDEKTIMEEPYFWTWVQEWGGPVIWLFSEVLEHLNNPSVYWRQIEENFGKIDDAYVASSFCTPAYGHHIPIYIGGKPYSTPRTANKAWREREADRGYELRKVEGWNSRLYHLKRG